MNNIPAWIAPYAAGEKSGWSQAVIAYSDYYCVDGSADDDWSIEERLTMHRQPMVAYASHTGTKRNLAAMKEAGWHMLLSPKGSSLRSEGMPYALDNGAWTAYQQGQPFDEGSFLRAVDLVGERAEWIVLPDVVQGGMASLEFSLAWKERLRGIPTKVLIAVQDGVQLEDVAHELSPAVGIFIGGSTEWKEATAGAWGSLARRRNCHLHVGRVNTVRRIKICAAAGANSIDGTSVSRYAKTLPKLDAASRQDDFFSTADESLRDAQQASSDVDLCGLVRYAA
ncbi:hypothetical protein BJG93_34635 (plasmid) [Paraburkholderia sprentiae WSM5005]|uniref:Uncharacterized protein n=1 Tax=Paraburkholderia sprentiae WSM5005 TaxID=754502 RepID=A0ACA8AX15_9BURK|nr:hypothetical protein [Paraburkholderia sprentiae]APA90252.1 hypothetical protein BJG93_34635 [Paraburkholderia sprentiae WSM5005]